MQPPFCSEVAANKPSSGAIALSAPERPYTEGLGVPREACRNKESIPAVNSSERYATHGALEAPSRIGRPMEWYLII